MSNRNGLTISMKRLAEIVGVSPGTVSLVLGGKGDELRIAKLTQEKILEMAVQYGYRAPEGRSTGQGKRWRIYVFCPFEERVKVINGRNVYGLHQAILEEHLEVDISLQPYIINRLEECKNLFSPKYCDGIIVSGLGEQDMNFLTRFKFDVPVVLFNRPNERYSSVYVDNYEAGRKAARLFSKKKIKRVGLLQTEGRSKAVTLLMMGFLDGCEEYGLEVTPEHIVEASADMAGGRQACQKFLKTGMPDAVFIINPDALTGFLSVLSEKRISVPDQLKIITYGDENLGKELFPSQTMIHMPVEDMMAACLKMVLNKIGQPNAEGNVVMQVMSVHFSFQSSCPE